MSYLKDRSLIKKHQADIVVQEALLPTQDIENETTHQEEAIDIVDMMITTIDLLEGKKN